MRSFGALWSLAFVCELAGGLFQLYMQPELGQDVVSFKPDWSRIGDLLNSPGRILGHFPALFLMNAALLAGLFAVVFCREADR